LVVVLAVVLVVLVVLVVTLEVIFVENFVVWVRVIIIPFPKLIFRFISCRLVEVWGYQ